MTREEWELVEQELEGPLGHVCLMCDGYKLLLEVQLIKPLRLAIMTYVNGLFKYEWIFEDCEIRRKFMCPKAAYIWPDSARRRLKKLSKKAQQEYAPDLDKKFTTYSPVWTSFQALRAHLRKNCKSIELVKS